MCYGRHRLFFYMAQRAALATEFCTSLLLDVTLTMRCAKNTQHNMSEVLRLPRKMTMKVSKTMRLPYNDNEGLQSDAPATKNATHLLKMT